MDTTTTVGVCDGMCCSGLFFEVLSWLVSAGVVPVPVTDAYMVACLLACLTDSSTLYGEGRLE